MGVSVGTRFSFSGRKGTTWANQSLEAVKIPCASHTSLSGKAVKDHLTLISQVNTASTYGGSKYGGEALSHSIAGMLSGYPPRQRATPLHGGRRVTGGVAW